MCIRRGDLRSPAGEHSSPLPCFENILMRTSLMRVDFYLVGKHISFQKFKASCIFFGTGGVKTFALDYYRYIELNRFFKHVADRSFSLTERF